MILGSSFLTYTILKDTYSLKSNATISLVQKFVGPCILLKTLSNAIFCFTFHFRFTLSAKTSNLCSIITLTISFLLNSLHQSLAFHGSITRYATGANFLPPSLHRWLLIEREAIKPHVTFRFLDLATHFIALYDTVHSVAVFCLSYWRTKGSPSS